MRNAASPLIAFTWGAGAGHPAGDHPAGLLRRPPAPGRGAAAIGGEEAAPCTHRHEDFIILYAEPAAMNVPFATYINSTF
jgi:hypothetical protein